MTESYSLQTGRQGEESEAGSVKQAMMTAGVAEVHGRQTPTITTWQPAADD